MLVVVFSCLIFPHSHTTIMLYTRWQYRVSVTSRHSGLQNFRLTSFNSFIMQRVIPILSPLVFIPYQYSSFHNSKTFTSILVSVCTSTFPLIAHHQFYDEAPVRGDLMDVVGGVVTECVSDFNLRDLKTDTKIREMGYTTSFFLHFS